MIFSSIIFVVIVGVLFSPPHNSTLYFIGTFFLGNLVTLITTFLTLYFVSNLTQRVVYTSAISMK